MWTEPDAHGFATRLTLLAELLAEPMSPTRLAGYRAALDDLPVEDVYGALGQAAKECRFFPRPVELREFAHAAQQARDRVIEESFRLAAHERAAQQLETRQDDLAERERTFAERLQREREAWEQGQPARDAAFAAFQAAMREVLKLKTMPSRGQSGHRKGAAA
jgi:hypothetical protein